MGGKASKQTQPEQIIEINKENQQLALSQQNQVVENSPYYKKPVQQSPHRDSLHMAPQYDSWETPIFANEQSQRQQPLKNNNQLRAGLPQIPPLTNSLTGASQSRFGNPQISQRRSDQSSGWGTFDRVSNDEQQRWRSPEVQRAKAAGIQTGTGMKQYPTTLSPNLSPIPRQQQQRQIGAGAMGSLDLRNQSSSVIGGLGNKGFNSDDFLNEEEDPEMFAAIMASLLPGEQSNKFECSTARASHVGDCDFMGDNSNNQKDAQTELDHEKRILLEIIQLSKLEDEKRKGKLNLDFLKKGKKGKADEVTKIIDDLDLKVDPTIQPIDFKKGKGGNLWGQGFGRQQNQAVGNLVGYQQTSTLTMPTVDQSQSQLPPSVLDHNDMKEYELDTAFLGNPSLNFLGSPASQIKTSKKNTMLSALDQKDLDSMMDLNFTPQKGNKKSKETRNNSNLKTDYETLLDDLNRPLDDKDKTGKNGNQSRKQPQQQSGYKLNDLSESEDLDHNIF